MSDDKPGYFESEIDGYPGSFTLPHPFLDRHMREWWDAAFKKRKGTDVVDYEYAEFEWEAYVALITKYGSWDVEGVPVGDLDGGGMPMVVKAWVVQEASTYIIPFVPQNRLRGLVGSL